jgi:hypothetical protein
VLPADQPGIHAVVGCKPHHLSCSMPRGLRRRHHDLDDLVQQVRPAVCKSVNAAQHPQAARSCRQ